MFLLGFPVDEFVYMQAFSGILKWACDRSHAMARLGVRLKFLLFQSSDNSRRQILSFNEFLI